MTKLKYTAYIFAFKYDLKLSTYSKKNKLVLIFSTISLYVVTQLNVNLMNCTVNGKPIVIRRKEPTLKKK